MNLKDLTENQLLAYRDRLKALHLNCKNKAFYLDDKPLNINPFPLYASGVTIQDSRLNDLIFTLFVEVHNELVERFQGKTIWFHDAERLKTEQEEKQLEEELTENKLTPENS